MHANKSGVVLPKVVLPATPLTNQSAAQLGVDWPRGWHERGLVYSANLLSIDILVPLTH